MKKFVAMALLALAGAGAVQAEHIWVKSKQYVRYVYNGFGPGEAGFKAKFGVWPVAAGHTAGAVWTGDGWATANWTTASWCRNVTGPYGNVDEEWNVGLTRSVNTYGLPNAISFAVYVVNSAGVWTWDNNNNLNHTVYLNQAFNTVNGAYAGSCAF